jgi:hypothetical protein
MPRSTKVVQEFLKGSHTELGDLAAVVAHRVIEIVRNAEEISIASAINHVGELTGISPHTLVRMWKYDCVAQPHDVLSSTWDALLETYLLEVKKRLHDYTLELVLIGKLRGAISEGHSRNKVARKACWGLGTAVVRGAKHGANSGQARHDQECGHRKGSPLRVAKA